MASDRRTNYLGFDRKVEHKILNQSAISVKVERAGQVIFDQPVEITVCIFGRIWR
jgi:hypothetical protein